MAAYYNEIDPFAAEWLRQLIKAGHIADGEVDERTILDVDPYDLWGFTQCHFFAGIGVWSHSLRRAGWSDDRPIWTGSCPCQPFSAAGAGAGFADERHLWPAFHHLVRQCRPETVVGEQVASKDGLAWLDLVQADMEGEDYAFAAVDLCAAGVGAPHIRQRLWWVGLAQPLHAERRALGVDRDNGRDGQDNGRAQAHGHAGARGEVHRLADAERIGREVALLDTGGVGSPGVERQADVAGGDGASGDRLAYADDDRPQGRLPGRQDAGRQAVDRPAGRDGADNGLADAAGGRQREQRDAALAGRGGHADGCGDTQGGLADADDRHTGPERQQHGGQFGLHAPNGGAGGQGSGGPQPGSSGGLERPGAADGFWDAVDWLYCRDGKWRPVEPGTFPLAHGLAARVGRLRGYGNAINAEAARIFVESVMDAMAGEGDFFA